MPAPPPGAAIFDLDVTGPAIQGALETNTVVAGVPVVSDVRRIWKGDGQVFNAGFPDG